MKKDKNLPKEELNMEECTCGNHCDCQDGCECQENSDTQVKNNMNELNTELEKKTKQCEEYIDKLQRIAAEFDNYKKRTAKEKEALYNDAVADVVASIIPVTDNIDRAIGASSGDVDAKTLREGIELVQRQFKEILCKIGVEEIKCVGEKFDPNIHNAVMHVEDESFGESEVIEEFQKGYIIKERVVRHSMVKVAN